MKKIRLRLLLLLWFTASVSIANTHIHHDAHEHEDCAKCYVYNLMSGADASVGEPLHVQTALFATIIQLTLTKVEIFTHTSFDARAPPLV